MFMMSRDHLAMDIEKSSLQLMLRLLNTDNVGKITSDHVEYDKIRQRLQVICSPASVTSGRSQRSKSISFEDITVRQLLNLFVSNFPRLFVCAVRVTGPM